MQEMRWQELKSIEEERKSSKASSDNRQQAGELLINIVELNNHAMMAEALRYHHR